MRKLSQTIIVTLIIGFLAAFSLMPLKPGTADAAEPGIKIMQKEAIGSFLAAANGMTLYTYSRDEKNVSNCIEGCALNWPPYHAESSSIAEGLEAGDFAAITRDDGRSQTTYRGMPLYLFIKDKYPGDTFGDGLGGVWSLVKP